MPAPQRTCIACRRKGDQNSFLRVSRAIGGRALLLGQGVLGRSAYLCPSESCIESGLMKGRLERALKGAVTQEERERLKDELLCKLR